MSDETREQWGWYRDGEHGHGPFDSQAEAIKDARGYYDGDGQKTEVYVGRITHLSAEACLPDLDGVMDIMEERAHEDFGTEERMFDYHREAAGEALHAALVKWADEHLNWSAWFRIESDEEIVCGEVTP